MAVVDSYYGIRRNKDRLALPVMLEAFFDEREGMNRALMAQRIKAAGVDDAALTKIEADLRREAARLEKAKGEALAGNIEAAMELGGQYIRSGTMLKIAEMQTKTKASVATADNRAKLKQQYMKDASENRKLLTYDEERGRQTAAAVNDMANNGASASDPQAMNALFAQLDGQRSQTRTTGSADKLIDDQMQRLRNKGRGDIADAISRHYFGGADNRAYMMRMHGDATEEEIDKALDAVGAGAPGSGDFGEMVYDRAKDAADSASSFGFKGTVPTEGGEDVSRGTPATGGGIRGVKITGPPGTVGTAMAAALDPNASPETIAAAFQNGIDDLTAQANRVRDERSKPRDAIFSGANYLLDNPNFVRRPGPEVDLYRRVGSRPMEVGDEFANEPGTDKQALQSLAARGFDPDDYDPTLPDEVTMGKGGEASVYLTLADSLDDPRYLDALLPKLPARVREIVKPYLDLHKVDPKQAKSALEELAKTDSTTMREMDADEIDAAAKNPKKIPDLVARMELLDTPYAKAILKTIDDGQKDHDIKWVQQRFAKIGNAIRGSDRTSASDAHEQALLTEPPSPKVAREKAEGDAYAKGKSLAKDTYDAWQAAGTSLPEIQDRIGILKVSSPLEKGLREGLNEIHSKASAEAQVVERNLEKLGSRTIDTSDTSMKLEKPDPKVVDAYRKRTGQTKDEETYDDADLDGAMGGDEFDDADLEGAL